MRGGALPFGLAAAAVFLWWATREGGYAPTAWYPGALVFLVLVVAVVVLTPARRAISAGWPRRAIVLLAAFAAWSFLSIHWATVRGDAWDGANRTLLYVTVYSTFALLCWRARDAALVVGLFASGTAAIGVVVLATQGASGFIDGRLAEPTGYANANAALFLAAFWPAMALAARAEIHWAARGLMLATGGALIQLAVLAQSRGSVLAGTAALMVFVLLSAERLRAVLVLLPAAAVTFASLDPLLSVFASGTDTALREAVAREQLALALSTGALLALGAVIGLIDRPGRFASSRPLPRRRAALLAALAAAGAALLATAVVVTGLTRSSEQGEARSGVTSALGSSRFGGSLETGRFDMWRVAAQTVAEHPFLGVGADNFAVDFAEKRRIDEEPLYPHSLVLRAFSQTGLVGGALFLGFTGAALLAAVRRRRRSDAFTNAVSAGLIASAVYWLVHGSIDWFWEIPVLAAPALAFLGLASGLGEPSSARSSASLPGGVVIAILGVAAVGSYLLPGAAAYELERAVRAWPEAPARALSHLDRARRFNPLSERADIVAGTLAQRARQPDRARIAFERALERNASEWYAQLQLALLSAGQGRRAEALAELRRAAALNPREPAIDAATHGLFVGETARRELVLRLDRLAVRSPLGRRPVDCRPVLGIANRCA
jgi:tetratricopeptide (TPR) repeat protein